jgi:hypothetical protein
MKNLFVCEVVVFLEMKSLFEPQKDLLWKTECFLDMDELEISEIDFLLKVKNLFLLGVKN